MTTEPVEGRLTVAESLDSLNHRQWDRYVTLWTYGIAFTVFGLIAFVAGFAWGMTGMEGAFVETEMGVTIVEGGMERGAFLGPFVGALGMFGTLIGHEMLSVAYHREVNV